MNIILAGTGAFGLKHLDGIAKIDGIKVVALVGRRDAPTQKIANE